MSAVKCRVGHCGKFVRPRAQWSGHRRGRKTGFAQAQNRQFAMVSRLIGKSRPGIRRAASD